MYLKNFQPKTHTMKKRLLRYNNNKKQRKFKAHVTHTVQNSGLFVQFISFLSVCVCVSSLNSPYQTI